MSDDTTKPDALAETAAAPAPKRAPKRWPIAVFTAPAIRDELARRRALPKWEVPKVRDDRKRTPEELRRLIADAQKPRPPTPDPSAARVRALENALRRSRTRAIHVALAIAAIGMVTTFIGGWIWLSQPSQIGGAISALGVAIAFIAYGACEHVG
ncbi:MAG: hypothetical protein QM831_04235 [Kofleriaceae bacterium]